MGQEAFASCRFYVEISGLVQAVFTEVSGLSVEVKVDEYEEGGNNHFTYRLPGRVIVGNIVLKRGMVATAEFYKWQMEIAQGMIKRRNITIRMFDSAGKEMAHWDFAKAYPIKWSGPQFAADGTTAAIETLELAHDGLVPS
jgi:phage tail-like protein